MPSSRILLAVTGASGAIYADRAVKIIRSSGNDFFLLTTAAARKVISLELGNDALGSWERQASAVFTEHDIDACVASGSCPVTGMLVAPSSLDTAMALASGLASNLVQRAGQVMLKERRPLVLVLRESPLASIHLRRLAELSESGAVIMPASPFFYHSPVTIGELVDGLVARALRMTGLDVPVPEWQGPE